MQIEIQFRTRLQHLWATAVETMGLFTNEAIKSGCGSKDVRRFFILVSALFAREEGTANVPGVSEDVDEVISEIELLNSRYNYLDFLSGINVAVDNYGKEKQGASGYCVLRLDYSVRRLSIKRFPSSEIEEANRYYNQLEERAKEGKIDAVLIRTSSFKQLKAAYPNYFSDIGEFVLKVKLYLK